MSEKLRTRSRQSSRPSSASSTLTSESEKLEITLAYNEKNYRLRLPGNADSKTISGIIKRKTGVKGAFYIHYGDGDDNYNYLHSSSLTSANICRLAGLPLEIRGGNWINKGGDAIWYYFSQTPKPDVIKKFKELQHKPRDLPP
ncbi:uncharacterized protein LOC116617610 [Nematostella vectensis]|uniref:uncharacterized protein LOC116617610 n=1 Tax=Nematostella vectensis TaxID=45351 RepID=UPI0013904ABE|nr:uncharacterized protein LOC116617610 [Nematostella vectensis]